jgi:hypothetical protein
MHLYKIRLTFLKIKDENRWDPYPYQCFMDPKHKKELLGRVEKNETLCLGGNCLVRQPPKKS